MNNQKITQTSEFSSRDDANKQVRELFRRVDMLLKNGEISRAQEELKIANKLRKELNQGDPFSLLGSDNCALPENPLPLKPMDAMIKSILSQRQKNDSATQSTATSATPPIASDNEIDSRNSKIQKPERQVDRKYELQGYRDALIDAWQDGALTQSEDRQLRELRSVLDISDAEHQTMEAEIKYKCYKDAVLKQMTENPEARYDTKLLSELQQAFHITQQLQPPAQTPYITVRQKSQPNKIFIIDDEVQFLKVLSSSLSEDGFDIIAVLTSEQALQLLQEQSPDLILCDINLKSSSMNGFNLFLKIQEIEHLQQVPFIFMTGVVNEDILRSIKEIGADDCLVKPFSKQTLLSTLRGKLKRFKQLKNLAINKQSNLLQ